MNKKLLLSITGGLVLYLFSGAASYAIFNYFKTPVKITTTETTDNSTSGSGFNIDPQAPKTEECPINGAMRTKKERELWEKRRPLGIMVENHEESRPQSGLSDADIIYEAVAEGGITRFLLVYYCGNAETVGPVRSARTYFIDYISEYGDQPLYTHVGGANTPGPANALGQIEDYGWVGKNDLNQFSIGFPTFWRDYERLGKPVATEHTVYSATQKLWAIGEKRGLTNVDENDNKWDEKFEKWTFKEDIAPASRPASGGASFVFWKGYDQYGVRWVYDPKTNEYKRFNGGVPHLDRNNNKQLSAKNIILVFTDEENANDGYENNAHLLYGTTGKGKAVILQDGVVTEGQWSKKNRLSRMKFYNADGEEIKLNKGQTWIEVLAIGTPVNYQ